ncbi:M28 family metallopeptidase [Sphingomonas cavernae]|uniref:M28 family peptidase n=1 Tax=Sphingomonas cavernae TaxID=2320861 RepID=A0A418WSV4_9SPHN|nr:M28 family metallopeptidase [Sphingomonas cavernae]RJF94287.1 M28 family peptidase [Sphingomonas cavernae]
MLAQPALAAPRDSIDPKHIEATVKAITADEFEGRAPGTPGEEKTIAWLVAQFKALGLEPGGPDGQWTQPVPLLHTRLGTPAKLEVARGGAAQPLDTGKDIYLSTLQPRDRAVIANAPMVFVGYGVKAPERGWDDLKGVDLKGKVAVFLINDPDFEAKEGEAVKDSFGGRTMTYYGRWTYKFEEAARQGAIGALIVHDTPGAGYGWNVVLSPGGENYDMVRPADKITSVALQGWLSGEAATALFKEAGLDLAALRVQARTRDFRPVPLSGVTFSADIPVTREVVQSRNVLGKISGAKRPQEVVMLGAHWDAYGVGKPDAQGRTIRAGANDDGIGVAALLEMARLFRAGPKPERTIVFGMWSAEERGLLGSETYAANPVYAHEKTVANLTVDVLQTAGRAKDVILIGKGQNTLEDDLARFAAKQGRTITPDAAPERGLFYRADHFPLAKRGVPVLLMMGLAGGADLVEGGRAAGEKWVSDYTTNCYHQACDAWSPDWNLDGAVMDMELVRSMASELANSNRWPEWKAGSEFKDIRDKSAAGRR